MARMREEFGRKVIEILSRHGVDSKPLSSRTAGRITELSHATIQNMADGKVPSEEVIRQFADGLKESRCVLLMAGGYLPQEEDILHDEAMNPSYSPRAVLEDIRVLGGVPCGGTELKEQEEGIPLSEITNGEFLLVAEGECMEPHIYKGDFLVIKKQPAQLGDIVLFTYEGENSCKLLTGMNLKDGQTVYTLCPTKAGFSEIVSADVEIQGVVIEILNRKKPKRIQLPQK